MHNQMMVREPQSFQEQLERIQGLLFRQIDRYTAQTKALVTENFAQAEAKLNKVLQIQPVAQPVPTPNSGPKPKRVTFLEKFQQKFVSLIQNAADKIAAIAQQVISHVESVVSVILDKAVCSVVKMIVGVGIPILL